MGRETTARSACARRTAGAGLWAFVQRIAVSTLALGNTHTANRSVSRKIDGTAGRIGRNRAGGMTHSIAPPWGSLRQTRRARRHSASKGNRRRDVREGILRQTKRGRSEFLRSFYELGSNGERRPQRPSGGASISARDTADTRENEPAVERDHLAADHGREWQACAPRSLMITSDDASSAAGR